jgi:hypothetical protein
MILIRQPCLWRLEGARHSCMQADDKVYQQSLTRALLLQLKGTYLMWVRFTFAWLFARLFVLLLVLSLLRTLVSSADHN